MNIGEFARLGRVSVRMLRHYDALGLLRPAHVDPATGYRSYEVAQLARLNRIVVLKELGLPLRQVAEILDERLDVGQLHGMLRLRRAELAATRLHRDESSFRETGQPLLLTGHQARSDDARPATGHYHWRKARYGDA